MGLRDRLRRLQKRAEGPIVTIPQRDGTVKRFPQRQLAEAFMSNANRLKASVNGEPVPDEHPVVVAAANSSDPAWRDSFFGEMDLELGEVEDLSE